MTERMVAGALKRENVDPRVAMEEKYALPYHWFPVKRIRWFDREELKRIVFGLIDAHTRRPVGRYLDVGCGDGRWTSDIYQHLGSAPETTGMDLSERAIAFARLICPELRFEVGSVERLPLADASVDLASAVEVIEHLPDEIEETALREIRRVLRPTGLLVLTTPTWHLKLPREHFRHYSIERLHGLLEAAGFGVLETRGHARPCYGWQRRLRGILNQFPKLWRLAAYYHRETAPRRALTLLVAARPLKGGDAGRGRGGS